MCIESQMDVMALELIKSRTRRIHIIHNFNFYFEWKFQIKGAHDAMF